MGEEVDVIELAKASLASKVSLDWYRKTTGDTNRLDLGSCGIRSLEDIYICTNEPISQYIK